MSEEFRWVMHGYMSWKGHKVIVDETGWTITAGKGIHVSGGNADGISDAIVQAERAVAMLAGRDVSESPSQRVTLTVELKNGEKVSARYLATPKEFLKDVAFSGLFEDTSGTAYPFHEIHAVRLPEEEVARWREEGK